MLKVSILKGKLPNTQLSIAMMCHASLCSLDYRGLAASVTMRNESV